MVDNYILSDHQRRAKAAVSVFGPLSSKCAFVSTLLLHSLALNSMGQPIGALGAPAKEDRPVAKNLPSITSGALAFVPVTPCRIADTRNPVGSLGGPTLVALATRDFPVPTSNCNIPANAQAYSLNVTVVPQQSLGFVTIWPTGQSQPVVSILNAVDGRVKANGALVPAGVAGSVSVYATEATDLILDINGYFVSRGTPNSSDFNPLTPCRIMDTRTPLARLARLDSFR